MHGEFSCVLKNEKQGALRSSLLAVGDSGEPPVTIGYGLKPISLQNLFTSSRGSFLRVAYHSEIVRLLSLTFARTASSIPLGPFQQRTFVVLRNCCSLESFTRWTINLASCRHTAGFVL